MVNWKAPKVLMALAPEVVRAAVIVLSKTPMSEAPGTAPPFQEPVELMAVVLLSLMMFAA